MPRLMSVSLTEPAVRDRAKTVTRRKGWKFLKPGDVVTLCPKVMGRKETEPLDRICDVEIVDVRREPLRNITTEDVAAEGFPYSTRQKFIDFFCHHMGVTPVSDRPESVETLDTWGITEPVQNMHSRHTIREAERM